MAVAMIPDPVWPAGAVGNEIADVHDMEDAVDFDRQSAVIGALAL